MTTPPPNGDAQMSIRLNVVFLPGWEDLSEIFFSPEDCARIVAAGSAEIRKRLEDLERQMKEHQHVYAQPMDDTRPYSFSGVTSGPLDPPQPPADKQQGACLSIDKAKWNDWADKFKATHQPQGAPGDDDKPTVAQPGPEECGAMATACPKCRHAFELPDAHYRLRKMAEERDDLKAKLAEAVQQTEYHKDMWTARSEYVHEIEEKLAEAERDLDDVAESQGQLITALMGDDGETDGKKGGVAIAYERAHDLRADLAQAVAERDALDGKLVKALAGLHATEIQRENWMNMCRMERDELATLKEALRIAEERAQKADKAAAYQKGLADYRERSITIMEGELAKAQERIEKLGSFHACFTMEEGELLGPMPNCKYSFLIAPGIITDTWIAARKTDA